MTMGSYAQAHMTNHDLFGELVVVSASLVSGVVVA